MIKYTAILKNDATLEEVNNGNLRVTVHISLYFEVIELAEDLEEFEEWARERYREVTINRWVEYLKAIEEAGIDIENTNEDAIISVFNDKDRKQALTAFQHYCEFRLDDFRKWCTNKYAKSATNIKGGVLKLLRQGIDLDNTSEEGIREMWYNKHHKQRTIVLRGFRKYQEFLKENGGEDKK